MIGGAKNAAVAVIPAALLTEEICVVDNLPYINDVFALRDMLEFLGAKVELPGGGRMVIDPSGVQNLRAPENLTKRMRASYYLMPVLLGRFGRAELPFPGGCAIGARPIDQTLKGLYALGADVENVGGVLCATSEGLRGGDVYLDMPSVGATINTMLAAVLAKGNTTIVNVAKEPHIVDCANFLNSMGANIKGAGTDTIRIRGVKRLHGTEYTIIPDYIETGTMMIAAAASHGDVVVRNVIPTHVESVSAKLMEMGVRIDEGDDYLHVHCTHVKQYRAANIKTQPYPGFPTDLQQPTAVLLSTAKGTSIITETIYENRFKYIEEVRRMGANVRIIDRVALLEGVDKLYGARVRASDLRAGAALVIAGLMAEGETIIEGVRHINRGYENIATKLAGLGADVQTLIDDLPEYD